MRGAKKRARRGLRRVILHIAVLALLGICALVAGVIGRGMLLTLTESARTPERVSQLHKDIRVYIKSALPNATDDVKQQNAVYNTLSYKHAGLKEAIRAQVEAGAPDADIVNMAIDTYMEGVGVKIGQSDPALYAAVLRAVDDARADIVQKACASAGAAVADITTASVRMDMSVTSTEYYAIMYYATPLIVAGAVCLFLSALLTIVWFRRDEEGRAKLGQFIEPFDYLLPFFLGVAVFTLYPMLRVLVMSFQERYQLGKNATGTFTQWGLGNYAFVLKGVAGTSNVFLKGLRNTAVYVAFTIPISTAISILTAYLLNQKIKLMGLFQTGYFLPMVTSVTAVGLVWRWMFNYKFGLINAIMNAFGAASLDWLSNSPMTVLVIFGVWSSLPFTIILLLSGLQNIDDHLYTVAKVDGSGAARIFFKITVPLLSPTIGLVLIINSISAFKVYTDVVVLWNGAPENFGMQTVTWYIYDQINTIADGTHSLGYAAAAAMVLFVIIFLFTMAQRLIQRKWVYQ